jgi:hypothetical protein
VKLRALGQDFAVIAAPFVDIGRVFDDAGPDDVRRREPRAGRRPSPRVERADLLVDCVFSKNDLSSVAIVIVCDPVVES